MAPDAETVFGFWGSPIYQVVAENDRNFSIRCSTTIPIAENESVGLCSSTVLLADAYREAV